MQSQPLQVPSSTSTPSRAIAVLATGLLGTTDAAARRRDALIERARSRADVYEALLTYHFDTKGRPGADALAALAAQGYALWAWLHNPVCLGCADVVVDPADARYVAVWGQREHGRVVHDQPDCGARAAAGARIRSWGGCPAWLRRDETAFLAALRERDTSAIADALDETTTPTPTGEAR